MLGILPVYAQDLIEETVVGEGEEVADVEESIDEDEEIEEEEESLAVITLDDSIQLNRATIFDASSSVLPEEYGGVVYTWVFGDGNVDQGVEVVHSYGETGEYVVELKIEIDGELYAEISKDIFVYSQFYVMITDQGDEQERIESLESFARDRGVYVHVISYYGSTSEF
ncbi:MAG: PKD domain-containing protein, partial [Candidatus Peregrinibacteria bacterium]|nr:PKD domain-containing protein [Candidatus Peregrinibacteria bacterium]